MEKIKTKQYLLTEIEVLAIRDALIEFKQQLKNVKPISDIAIAEKKAVTALVEQFKDDVRLWK